MADINIGSAALLTTTLNDNDRVTITRAATGQQVATMTVGDFMVKCADMMRVATSSAKGLMDTADKVKLSDKLSTDGKLLDDCNNAKALGCYSWKPSTLNAPPWTYGVILAVPNFDGAWIAQLAFCTDSTGFYFRMFTNTTWIAWRKVI